MTSIAKLAIQGFTFGMVLSSGGCMPQQQNEIEQLRAEIADLKSEVAALKGGTPAAAQVAETPAEVAAAEAAQSAEPSAESAPAASAFDWAAAIEKHDGEKRDLAWARMREPGLFALAKAHIKESGASLNGVRCKETSCLITINVPKAPKAEYQPLANPWAQVTMAAQAKPSYNGRTQWTYLLLRHEKDTPEAGAERVDPAALALSSPELVQATIIVPFETESTPEKVAKKPAAKTHSATAKPTAAPAKSAAPEAKPASAGPAASSDSAKDATAQSKPIEPAAKVEKPADKPASAAATPGTQPAPTAAVAAPPAQPEKSTESEKSAAKTK